MDAGLRHGRVMSFYRFVSTLTPKPPGVECQVLLQNIQKDKITCPRVHQSIVRKDFAGCCHTMFRLQIRIPLEFPKWEERDHNVATCQSMHLGMAGTRFII